MEPKINAKSWNPALEQEILKSWTQSSIYAFTTDGTTKPFVIDTPPPYPSGRPWHMGAAAHYSQIDMIARTARMSGYNVLFPIGIDRNGLPVEIYTEKKHKIRMRRMDRQKFLDLCKVSLDDLESEMIQIMKNMGMSADFDKYYRTDSEEFRALTQTTFIELWNRGLVYLANRPNNYCIDCGTTIADAEITYEDIPTTLVYLRFGIKETGENLIVATTRPELLYACQMVMVNPDDARYEKLLGKHVTLPLFDRQVQVRAHHSARPDFGSGAVMVCSYGDQNDVQLFRELSLQEIVALDENGKTSTAAGLYANLSTNQARLKIIDDLEKMSFIEKKENIMHRTPLCERSKTPVEIIPMKDYYVKQLEYVDKLKALSKNIKFHPEMHRQILSNWLNSIAIDWPVSRRRYYGTEIPIWYCNSCKTPNVPEPGRYYRPWKQKPPFEKCSTCQGTEFTGEDRVFDTWMDSSITPLFITKFKKDESFFRYTYPTEIRPQAKDIIRTWLYYTMLRCVQLTDVVPWPNAWIMGYGVDEKGEKMSKSKGNVIDPFPIIQKYGADTFRFWSASEANLGYDFRCSEQRIYGAQKFLSKLWNIGRFVSSFEVVNDHNGIQLAFTDKWILYELSSLINECKRGYDEYNFFIPSNAIREFTWNLFAAHYVEMIKGRVYGQDAAERQSAVYALHKCFSTLLILMAPICPFITEKLWTEIYSHKSIHLELLPESTIEFPEMSKFTKPITEFNSLVWNTKKETNSKETGKPLSLKDPIKIKVPKDLVGFEMDLQAMHNLM